MARSPRRLLRRWGGVSRARRGSVLGRTVAWTLLLWGALAATATAQTYVTIQLEAAPNGNAALLGPHALAAGDSLRVYAAGYDGAGIYTGPVDVQWSAEPALVTMQPAQGTTSRALATFSGTCRLVARDGLGVEAWSDPLTVSPGAPAQLAAFATPPTAATIPLTNLVLGADSTLVVYAGAYDSFSNWIGPLEVQWSLDAPLGTVVPASASLTVLTATTAGSGHLRWTRAGVPLQQIPLQVLPGRLASLRIATRTAGPALGDTTLVVATSLQLFASGFDAHGNLLATPPSVDWSAAGTVASVAPAHASATTLTALVPGSTRVVVRSGAIAGSTGTVHVIAGVLARLRVSRAPDAYLPLGATTLDADSWLELFALGEDATGHLLGPVAANWSSTDLSVAKPASTSGTSVLVDAQRIGMARLVAERSDARADSSGTLTVIAGRTAQLRVETRADGTGIEIGALSLSADSSLTLCAVGRDADANFTAARPASWSVAGDIGTLSASAGSQVRLDATHAGTGLVTAIDFLLTDATGAITVLAGAPHQLRLEDDNGARLAARALRPGDGLAAFARGVDADGNRLDLRAVRWSWDGDPLAAPPALPASSFPWTASRTGRGRLVVADAGVLPDTSGWVTVTSGTLARLEIWDAANLWVADRSISADSTLYLHAMAFDAGGNPLGDVPVEWSIASAGGTGGVEPALGSSSMLHPFHAGGLVVAAKHASGVTAQTGALTILPGRLAAVSIESAAGGSGSAIGARSLIAGETLVLYAVGRDTQGNVVGPAEVSWILEGGIGSLSPTFGNAATLTAEHAGQGRVRATHVIASGAVTGDLVVLAGAPAVLVLERTAGDPADPLVSLSLAAGESLQVVAVARDASGNRVAEVPAAWNLLDDPTAGRLDPAGPASSVWLVPLRPGTVRVRAAWNGLESISPPLSLVAGPMATLTIETAADGTGAPIGDRNLTAGARLLLHAVARDGRGNFVTAVPVRWLLAGDAGALSTDLGASTLFTALRPGAALVNAIDTVLPAASTGTLRVAPGAAAVLRLERTPGDPADGLGTTVLMAGDSLAAFAVLRDSLGNHVSDAPVQWSLGGDAGVAELAPFAPGSDGSAIRVRALHPGSVQLQARWNTLTATSGAITIGVGRAARVAIETVPDGSGTPVGARTLGAGAQLELHAVARDEQGNFVGPVVVQWSLAGTIGHLQDAAGSSTFLLAERAGVGRVTALHPSLPAATTGEITVLAGVPAQLLIQRSAGDPAAVFLPSTLSADDSLAAFAVLRDSLGNFVGEAFASWEMLGDPDIAAWGTGAPASAASAVRLRALHPGNLQLRATWNGLTAASGALVLTAGRMTHAAIESAADGSGSAIGARSLAAGEELLLHAVARDSHGNFVAAVTVHWSQEGTSGRLDEAYAPSTRFVAERPGVTRVVAAHVDLGTSRTADLTVTAGIATQLVIERTAGDPADPLGAQQLAAGDSLLIFAVGRDSLGNLAGEAIANWSLAGDPNSVTLDASGPAGSTWLRAQHSGIVRVQAQWNGLVTSSGLVTIVAGPLSRFALESAPDGTGAPIGNRTLAAGEHLTLNAIGRDAQDNFVRAVDVSWSLGGAIGHLGNSSGPAATLVAERAGTGRVQAQHAILGAQATGDLTVLGGTPARLVLERTPGDPADAIGTLALTADDSLAVYAVLRDSLGNAVGAAAALWSLGGDPAAATLVPNGTVDATDHVWLHVLHPGVVQLVAQWNGLEGTSGDMLLAAGAPFGSFPVGIAPDSLRAGGADAARVTLGPVADQRGNAVADGTRLAVAASLGILAAGSDVDPASPGLQLSTQNGTATVMLTAPSQSGTGTVDASAGAATGTATIRFFPPLDLALVAGSLTPAVVQRGATVALRLQLENRDLLPVHITSATLHVEDGNGTRFDSPLAQALDIPPAGTAEAGFEATPVSALMHAGSYAPQLALHGTDGLGRPFDLSLALGASSLALVAGADLHATNRSPDSVPSGASVSFTVDVLNAGDVAVQLDATLCTLHDAAGLFVAALDPQGIHVVAAGQPAALHFVAAVWSPQIASGTVPLAADLQGVQTSGAFAQHLDIAAVRAQAPGLLQPVTNALSPAYAALESAPDLRLRLHNAGGSAVLLGAASHMQIGDREAGLAAAVAIAVDSTADLHFQPVDLRGLSAGRHGVQVLAQGTQNGFPFAQNLDLADSLLLFAPAALTIVGVQPSQATVTSGQVAPWSIDVLLLNAGQSTYRVDAADIHVILGGVDRTSTYTLVRTKPLGSSVSPAATDTLRFDVVRTGDDTGPATLDANVRAVDLVSGGTLDINTYQGGKGSVRVQLAGLPLAEPLQLAQHTASAGQTRPVEVLLPLRNGGEAALDLDVASLGTSFTCTPALPVQASIVSGSARLEAGAAVTLRYLLGPFPAPAGRIVLRAAPRFIETNRRQALSVSAAESLTIRTPAALGITAMEAPARVTRAQTSPWSVRATVHNAGESDAALGTPRLVIQRAGVDASAGFGILAPVAFASAMDFQLAGGATGQVDFTVTSTDTVAGDVQIEFASDGTELDSERRLDLVSPTPAIVRIEREPRIVVADSTLTPRVASQGQQIQFAVEVHNAGEAAFVVDVARSVIRLGGSSAVAALAAPATLGGGSTSTLRFQTLRLDVPAGDYPLQLELAGSENGNPFGVTLVTAGALHVEAAARLEIVAVQPSQPAVTSGQQRSWSTWVVVRNGGAPATLERAAVLFTLGPADVSAGFTVLAPAAFVSGRTALASGETDTLRLEVARTAALEGLVVLDAQVNARDANSGAALSAVSAGSARGSVRVLSLASPRLVALESSQPRVSAGQQTDWTVRLTVRNAGGTAWRPRWSSARLALGNAADDSILAPAGFDAGPEVLDGAATGSATFRVSRTGQELAALALVASLDGMQVTDGDTLAAAPAPAASVFAERPAELRLDSLHVTLARTPHVNTGQQLALTLQATNVGGAALGSCGVRLRIAGGAPAETLLTFALGGAGRIDLHPAVLVGASPGPVGLEATLQWARDANDSTRASAWSDSTVRLSLVAERPGALGAGLAPSQSRVSAGQSTAWWAELHLENAGDEPLALARPRAEDVTFQRAGVPQSDYLVVPPDSLLEGGLVLLGGAHGTLRYRIARTGSAGGEVAIAAQAAAQHTNDATSPVARAAASTIVQVDVQPGVRVLSTESITWRRQHQHDDFRVNAGQAFVLRVVVENTGGTYLDSVRVQVESQRGNSVVGGVPLLAELAPGQRGQLDLPVVAGTWHSEPGLPETFTAHVIAARDRNTSLSVLPSAAVDNTSFGYVESPAALDLSTFVESPEGATDGVLSAGQEFVLAARIDNQGGAGVSASGRVQLAAPADFTLLQGDAATFFAPGSVVRWTLRAPATPTASAESLTVRIAAVPLDQNDGQPAALVHATRAVPIEVRVTGELASTFAIAGPAGARDGILSTGQTLDLEVVATGSPDLTSRQAEVLLPSAWEMPAGQPAKRDLPNDPEVHAHWSVSAPSAPGVYSLVLRVTAVDPNDESSRVATDTLTVRVERAAELTLAAAIVSPEEAVDGRLLPGTVFQLQARIRNQGEAQVLSAAGYATHGSVRLADLPAGYATAARSREFTLGAGGSASIDWTITAPATYRPSAETLRLVFERLPVDGNSGALAAVNPDSSAARCVVGLTADGLQVEARAAASVLAAPGQHRIPLLALRIVNGSEHGVSLDSLGARSLVEGTPAARRPFTRLYLVRDDAPAETLAVRAADTSVTWFVFGAGATASLAAQATSQWTLLADLSADAPPRRLGVSLGGDGTSGPLVRAVETRSRTRVPVRVVAGAGLAGEPLRVVAATLAAYNAPNPFHAERELTTIHYQVSAPGEVVVRIHTLQGALVWETRRHEDTSGPSLRGVEWDGRNGAGQSVRNGVYICDVRVGAQNTRFKIAVVR